MKGLLENKFTWQDVKDTYTMNARASNMIYTLAFNEEVKAEYYRRYLSGEDPEKLVKDLSNPWIEFASSVAFSPSTYLGLSLPSKGGKILGIGAKADDIKALSRPLISIGGWGFGRTSWSMKQVIPTFGELVGLNLGKGRLLNETNHLVNPSDEIESALRAMGTTNTDKHAIDVVNRATARVASSVERRIRDYGPLAYTASAKAQLLSQDAGYLMQTIFSSGDIDDGFELMHAGILLRRGTDAEKAIAIRRLMNSGYGTMMFGDGALMTFEMSARLMDSGQLAKIMDSQRAYRMLQSAKRAGKTLEDSDLLKLANWYADNIGDDATKMSAHLQKELWRASRNMIPDVKDMHSAWKATRSVDDAIAEATRELKEVTELGNPEDIAHLHRRGVGFSVSESRC
jgi:hypothetical protein